MTVKNYRGVVRDGKVVLDTDQPLQEGTEVVVTPLNGKLGSGAAILAALDAAPPVPGEWVDELEALIAEGQRPPATPESFSDKPADREPSS